MTRLIHSVRRRQKGIKKAIIQQQYGSSKNNLIRNTILTVNLLYLWRVERQFYSTYTVIFAHYLEILANWQHIKTVFHFSDSQKRFY